MSRFTLFAAIALPFSSMLVTSTALAQEEGPSDSASVDVPEDEEPEDERRLRTKFLLSSELHSMNNLDMRERDESSDQSILETDDRNTFGYTSIAAELAYDVLDDTQFDVAAAHTGMWGNDQLGGLSGAAIDEQETELADRGAHFLWIYRLSVSWQAVESDAFSLETTIGRQDFEIGGVEDDYFFEDTVDGITIDIGMGPAGELKLLPLDFYAANASPEDVDFGDYVARQPTVMGFRGDTNTMRFGGVYKYALSGFEGRLFGFYADIGASTRATSTGADRTFNGTLGNFSDRDYSWMAGTRLSYDHELEGGNIGVFGEYARSGGIDRKDTEVGLFDVVNEGNALGGGLRGGLDLDTIALDGLLRYFHADGGLYARESGVQYSHGFVGMKGSETGGLNLDRYMGMHPSAYVDVNGIADHPQEVDRKSGTDSFQAGLGFDLADRFRTEFDAWYLIDTSQKSDPDRDPNTVAGELPFGYTEADIEAQERFGDPLGTELNLSFLFRANRALNFYTKGGLFLPSDYYATEIERTASQGGNPALGSPDPEMFWAVLGGTTLRF